jgi:hypothetical protein
MGAVWPKLPQIDTLAKILKRYDIAKKKTVFFRKTCFFEKKGW